MDEAGRGDRPLHVSVTPARPLDLDAVRAYAELGVHRLIVAPPPNPPLDESDGGGMARGDYCR